MELELELEYPSVQYTVAAAADADADVRSLLVGNIIASCQYKTIPPGNHWPYFFLDFG